MNFLLLVPGLISLFLVWRGRIETAFLNVYLPCLLMLPDDYSVRLPHLPPTSAAQFALIPIGMVGISRLLDSKSFALMDLLVVGFAGSIGLSEILHSAVVNDGLFYAFNAFVTILLAYVTGRTIIEPDLRVATVRKWVIYVLLDGIPGLYEWRMGQNLYGIWGQKFFGVTMVTQNVQMRGGHGRMGSVFAGGEPGGIAFAMTFCLNAWLVFLIRMKASVNLGEKLTKLQRYHIAGFLLFLYVYLTQSRGPLIGLAAAYIILQIPKFRNTRILTVVALTLLAGGYLAASAYFESYTDISNADPTQISEQQSSAAYRRVMNELYPPIAEKGGWTGYSALGIPKLPGMPSIDNHYLLVHLAWGRLGYIFFLLVICENIRVLLFRSWTVDDRQDRAFVFCMLGAMAVLWITLVTVFLGGQLPQISFLLIGWMQSTGQRPARGFSFQRVFN